MGSDSLRRRAPKISYPSLFLHRRVCAGVDDGASETESETDRIRNCPDPDSQTGWLSAPSHVPRRHHQSVAAAPGLAPLDGHL